MIKAENQFELTLPALSENEGFARQCVTGFLARLDPTVAELADLRTAVSEAVTIPFRARSTRPSCPLIGYPIIW